VTVSNVLYHDTNHYKSTSHTVHSVTDLLVAMECALLPAECDTAALHGWDQPARSEWRRWWRRWCGGERGGG